MGFNFPSLRLPAPPKINIPKIHIPAPKPIHIPPPPPIHIPKIVIPPVNIPKPKIDMKALQMATGIIGGVVSAIPMGKYVMMGITAAADAGTKGAASSYLNSGHATNSTLSMIPGAILAQRIANDATGGKSGAALNKYVPDPVHLAIADAKAVATAIATKPSTTLSVFKDALRSNVEQTKAPILNIAAATRPIIAPVSTLSARASPVITQIAATKPSLITMVAAIKLPPAASAIASRVLPAPVVAHTISGV